MFLERPLLGMVQSVDVAVTGSVGDAVTGSVDVAATSVGDGSVEVAVTGSVGGTWVLSSRELTRRNRLELDTYCDIQRWLIL